MRILVTNDDGLHAPGILKLAEVAREFGEVKLVAPDRERSACGHSMTMRDPLRMKKIDLLDYEAYEVDGVPVDCVNVALTCHWPDGCDLILSGINNGPNLGFDVTYSGTAAAAMEGVINGIPSIAISMASFVTEAPFHYETGARWLKENLQMLLDTPQKPLTFLNINVPAIDYQELQGHRFVRMGSRVYEDRVEERSDPWGRPYFWQGGVVVVDPSEEGSDVQAVSEGFVSITPVSLDWTDYGHLEALQKHAVAVREGQKVKD